MSIQSHSKPSSKLVIFSVYNWNYRNDARNKIKHEATILYLKSKVHDFAVIMGCYDGRMELSIIMDQTYLDRALIISMDALQDSILLLDEIGANGTRKAHLQYMDGRPTKTIGWLRESTRDAAIAMSDYSYNPKTDKYYIVESDYTKASQIQ